MFWVLVFLGIIDDSHYFIRNQKVFSDVYKFDLKICHIKKFTSVNGESLILY